MGEAKTKGKGAGHCQRTRGLISLPLLTSYVTSDKSLNLSELPFRHWKWQG